MCRHLRKDLLAMINTMVGHAVLSICVDITKLARLMATLTLAAAHLGSPPHIVMLWSDDSILDTSDYDHESHSSWSRICCTCWGW